MLKAIAGEEFISIPKATGLFAEHKDRRVPGDGWSTLYPRLASIMWVAAFYIRVDSRFDKSLNRPPQIFSVKINMNAPELGSHAAESFFQPSLLFIA